MKRDCRCPRARHEHGTHRAYIADRCRCSQCVRRFACWQKVRRLRFHRGNPGYWVSPVPSALRLQALAAVGWSADDLAPLLGTHAPDVVRWRLARSDRVICTTANRIAAVYDAVWDQRPPGRYAVKVKNLAARNGWVPPLELDDDELDQYGVLPIVNQQITTVMHADRKIHAFDVETHINRTREDYVHTFLPDSVDEIAVSERIAGRNVPLNPAELSIAIETLDGMGHSAKEIAQRLGTNNRAVQRNRARKRAA